MSVRGNEVEPFVSAITIVLRERAEKIGQEEAEKAAKRARERIGEAIASVVLDAAAFYEVERRGVNLVITVRGQPEPGK